MIDVMVERAFFFSRAYKNGIDADYAAPFTDHLNLLITDVAFDVVVAPDVRVRHDGRLCCDAENLFKPSRVDVGKINYHAEGFAFTHDLATKRCQTLSRRAARRENSAVPCRIGSGVRESDCVHTEFVKHAQLI